MCIVSDKIKLCSCKTDNTEKLNHYWILHRYDKTINTITLGTPILPSEFSEKHFNLNKERLLKRLNEADAFDIPIKFKAKDKLILIFNNLSADDLNRVIYCFRFKNRKWIVESFDAFELMDHYQELVFGKFKDTYSKIF